MIVDRKNLYRKPDGTTMTSQEQLTLLLSIGNFTSEEAADVTGVQMYTIKTYRKASSKRSVQPRLFDLWSALFSRSWQALQTLQATRWCLSRSSGMFWLRPGAAVTVAVPSTAPDASQS